MGRDLTLYGVLNGPGLYGRMLGEIASGALKPSWLIDGDYELSEADAALARVREPGRAVPKVLLRIDDDEVDGGLDAQ